MALVTAWRCINENRETDEQFHRLYMLLSMHLLQIIMIEN